MRTLESLLASSRRLFSADDIAAALDAVAEKISRDYAEQEVLLLSVMVGAVPTVAALMQRLSLSVQLDYIHATRYGKQLTGGDIHWQALPQTSLQSVNVLIVDDIFDEGHTLKAIDRYCRANGALSVKSAVLVNKIHSRKVADFMPDYIGLQVPDEYVFGYGMDCEGLGRNLPDLYALQNHCK